MVYHLIMYLNFCNFCQRLAQFYVLCFVMQFISEFLVYIYFLLYSYWRFFIALIILWFNSYINCKKFFIFDARMYTCVCVCACEQSKACDNGTCLMWTTALNMNNSYSRSRECNTIFCDKMDFSLLPSSSVSIGFIVFVYRVANVQGKTRTRKVLNTSIFLKRN